MKKVIYAIKVATLLIAMANCCFKLLHWQKVEISPKYLLLQNLLIWSTSWANSIKIQKANLFFCKLVKTSETDLLMLLAILLTQQHKMSSMIWKTLFYLLAGLTLTVKFLLCSDLVNSKPVRVKFLKFRHLFRLQVKCSPALTTIILTTTTIGLQLISLILKI